MTSGQILPALAALMVIYLLPRFAGRSRELVLLTFVSSGVLAILWFGLGLVATGNGLVLGRFGLAMAGMALLFGVIVRGVLIVGQRRNWPGLADLLLSLGGAVMLGVGFLRIFAAL